jgi:apolipoprotein N-acyltransferase
MPTAPPLAPLDRHLRGAGLNVLLVIASGVLTAFIFPPYEAWWLGWLTLIPLLIALRRTEAVRASGWLMLLFGLVFFSLTLGWLRSIFGVGAIGIAVLATVLVSGLDPGAAFSLATPRTTRTPYVAWTHRLVSLCLGISRIWCLWLLGSALRRRRPPRPPAR